MKKKLTLLMAALLSGSALFAQSLQFYIGVEMSDKGVVFGGEPVANGAEIIVDKLTINNIGSEDDPFWAYSIESGLGIKNTTSGELMTTGSQKLLSTPEYGKLSFCYGGCQVANGDLEHPEVPIPANSFNNGCHLSFQYVNGQYEEVKVLYKAVNDNDPNDVASVTVIYRYDENSTTGIASAQNNNSVNFYQKGNIAELTYNFDSDVSRQLKIYGVTGEQIASHTLSDANGSLSLPTLNKGIYFYSITENGKKIATRKFLIY